jgi:hypothetical protein
MDWARILANVTGTVDQELLAQNEYLTAETGILKAQLKGRPKLADTSEPGLARSLIAPHRIAIARARNCSEARRHPSLVPQVGRPQGSLRRYPNPPAANITRF